MGDCRKLGHRMASLSSDMPGRLTRFPTSGSGFAPSTVLPRFGRPGQPGAHQRNSNRPGTVETNGLRSLWVGATRDEEWAMFIQVFQAKLRDADLWSRRVATWRSEIRPKTTGFLGFTSGVTSDNYMITLARFSSEEAAKVDNDLPEQGAWFGETSKAFDGEVTFHDCREVDSLLDGGSDAAGVWSCRA